LSALAIASEETKMVSIEQLTAEINVLKQQTALNIVEIGRRLIQAKEQLPHGEWGEWLRNRVEFSHATANRFMQIAAEFENSSALRNLGSITKIYALLELPPGEREEFIESPHLLPSGHVKTVDEMTTRELQQVIKERDNARSELDKARQEAKRIEALLEEERKKAAEQIGGLQKQLIEEKEKGERATVAVKELSKLEAELKEANERVKRLEEEAKKPVTVEPAVIEKIPDSVTQELEELRQKAKSAQMSQAEVKFRIQFDAVVTSFRGLLAILDEIRAQTDDETHAKYKGAASQLLERMQNSL
jgi:hypothetical protein